MLPDIVELFGGGGADGFDVQREIAITTFLVAACAIIYLYAHFFLDDDLKRKKKE